ncbi:MAG: hypothetical protein LBF15_06845 [Candidatus Peribacteria bacterium]|jgi:ABC-type bacteriocin/lantibiotic exporter with double-glycine peptidase domain|nr:hypothetical protein [Candidatus Peribacteria bacterium]
MTKETNKKIIEIIVGTINIFFALLIIALAVISVFNKELVLGFIEWI